MPSWTELDLVLQSRRPWRSGLGRGGEGRSVPGRTLTSPGTQGQSRSYALPSIVVPPRAFARSQRMPKILTNMGVSIRMWGAIAW